MRMRISCKQCVKSTIGAAIGALPGVTCWWLLDYGIGWTVFLVATGVFIGVSLSLPSVSGRRVLGMTVSWIVGVNTSDAWGKSACTAIAKDYDDASGSIAEAPSNKSSVESDDDSWAERTPDDEASEPSQKGLWWWVAGMGGLALSIAGTCSQMPERFDADPAPQGLSPEQREMLDNLELRVVNGEIVLSDELKELEPVVVKSILPKPGEHDEVEARLMAELERERETTEPDQTKIQRLENSLKHWQNRKRKQRERHQ